ncbi:uncharacterized protein LOC126741433 [Anthonomus grandis grandis]|uniref:uncharacterized protein LOC126741433 n=1 Tax=Anthonomus grandis grandis TaxID=2921223 RepID=UPI002166780F|nr:uncharacterized protein LOC126741433 [Anthonomus grandis grandis]
MADDEALATALAQIARLQAQVDQLTVEADQPAVEAAPAAMPGINFNGNGEAVGANGVNVQSSFRLDHYRVPKLPPFSQVDPALWFIQAEVSMRNARILIDSTKADTVLAALDVEVLGCVRDIIIMNPPPVNIYEQIKARVIATYAESDEMKLRKLLKGQVGIDGKPSLMLSRLRGLSNGTVDDNIIRSIFLEQLPREHRAILVSAGVSDLNRLAEAADRIAECASTSSEPYIASASKPSATSVPAVSEMKQLMDSIAALNKKVLHLEKELKKTRSRSSSNSRRASNSREDSSSLCRAHTQYPDNPTSCRKWCSKYDDCVNKPKN